MSHKNAFIAELQMEAASSRKILERVPTEKNDWKPHDKSMKLGNLSTHVAEIPGWIAMTLTTNELDLAKMDYKPNIAGNTEELIEKLNGNINKAISALENSKEEDFEEIWTLRNGDHIIFALPKKVVIRNVGFSHMIHHRAQLGVYLRLLDVLVPGVYGPSADDMAAASAN